MAGRAGRLGLDTKGVVIHLNNLFELPTLQEYRAMLCGNPQRLESQFSIHFNLILRLLSIKQTDFQYFIEKSMLSTSINKTIHLIKENIKQEKQLIVTASPILTVGLDTSFGTSFGMVLST